MLSRRIATARPLRAALPVARRAVFGQKRFAAQTSSHDPYYPRLVREVLNSQLALS